MPTTRWRSRPLSSPTPRGGNLVSFLALPADAGVSALFDSRSFGTAGLRPVLTVIAVPEPGASALVVAGLFIFAARRGRLHA